MFPGSDTLPCHPFMNVMFHLYNQMSDFYKKNSMLLVLHTFAMYITGVTYICRVPFKNITPLIDQSNRLKGKRTVR